MTSKRIDNTGIIENYTNHKNIRTKIRILISYITREASFPSKTSKSPLDFFKHLPLYLRQYIKHVECIILNFMPYSTHHCFTGKDPTKNVTCEY